MSPKDQPDGAPVETAPEGPRIGLRIRHLRKVKGLRLKELADIVGCSESMISKIENDKATPSLAMLHRLVGALEANIGFVFGTQRAEEQVVARAGERPVIHLDALRHGEGITLERLIPYAEDHLLQANLHIIEPGGRSDGTIAHRGEELGYVLEGELELTVDGQAYRLAAGDSFHFRSDLPHGYRNCGTRPAKVIWVNTPPTF